MSLHGADAMSGRRGSWRLLGKLAVTGIVLGLLFVNIPLPEVGAVLGTAAVWPLALGLLASFTIQGIVALRLGCLLRGLGASLPLPKLFQVNLATLFYGLFLPGGNITGTAVRYYSLARHEADPQAILIALACDRLVATVTLCVTGFLFALIAAPPYDGPLLAVMALAIAGLLMVQAMLFTSLPLPMPRSVAQALARRLTARVGKIAETLRRARSLPNNTTLLVLALGVVIHLIGTGVCILAAVALDLEVSWLILGWVRAAAIFIAIAPVSISGLGVREGTFVLLLAAVGVDEAAALGLALLMLGLTIVVPGLLGGVLEARRLGIASSGDRRRALG